MQSIPELTKSERLQAKVCAESLTIPERHDLFLKHPNRFVEDGELLKSWMAAWQHALGEDEGSEFPNRLKSLNIDRKDLPFILGRITPDPTEAAPSWWAVCERVLEHNADTAFKSDFLTEIPKTETDDSTPDNGETSEENDKNTKPIPFEHAFTNWIDVATSMLLERCPSAREILGEHVLKD